MGKGPPCFSTAERKDLLRGNADDATRRGPRTEEPVLQVGRESNFPRQILKCAPEPRVNPPATLTQTLSPWTLPSAHGTLRRPLSRIQRIEVFATSLRRYHFSLNALLHARWTGPAGVLGVRTVLAGGCRAEIVKSWKSETVYPFFFEIETPKLQGRRPWNELNATQGSRHCSSQFKHKYNCRFWCDIFLAS